MLGGKSPGGPPPPDTAGSGKGRPRLTGSATPGYLAADAARLVGVPGDRIGQWARWGHIRASVSTDEPHVYAFADVAEALAVHLLLDAGLSLPTIRRAVRRLGGPALRPLSSGGVHLVDGRLAIERPGGLEDVFSAQRVLPLDAAERRGDRRVSPSTHATAGAAGDPIDATARLRRGGWIINDAVDVDPARLGGRPRVRGRRIAVEELVAAPSLAPRLAAAARVWWEASSVA